MCLRPDAVLIARKFEAMDGIEIAKMQESIGVRLIVEDIDALRMMLGNTCVTVLTPKVEVRLRSASKAHIPLKLTCLVNHISRSVQVSLTFPSVYPGESLTAEVTDSEGQIIADLSEKTQSFSENGAPASPVESEETRTYPRAAIVVNYLRQLLEAEHIAEVERLNREADLLNKEVSDDSVQLDQQLIGGSELGVSDEERSSQLAQERSSQLALDVDDKYYSCMLCGTFLFNDSEVERHSTTQKDHERRGGKVVACSSVFISSPPSFMKESQMTENTVKMTCIKCQGKLGLICWTGSQCSCGAWVTPAIQFISSKIDMKRKNFDILSYTNLKSSIPIIRR